MKRTTNRAAAMSTISPAAAAIRPICQPSNPAPPLADIDGGCDASAIGFDFDFDFMSSTLVSLDADVDIMFRSVVDDVGDTVLVSPAKLVPTDSVVDDTDDCVGADVASVTRIPGPLHIGCPFVDCESAVAPVNVSKILLQSHKKFKPLHVPVLPPLQVHGMPSFAAAVQLPLMHCPVLHGSSI
jgi:hypothetical protein